MPHIPKRGRDAAPGVVVVGAGPAGFGLLLAAQGAGLLDPVLALPLTILERDTRIGAGELGRYAIRSDSHAESFFRAVEAVGDALLPDALASPLGRHMLEHRTGSVALSAAAGFLDLVAKELRCSLAAAGRDPFVTGVEAVSAQRTADHGWQVRCRSMSDGSTTILPARALVLATGADQPARRLTEEVVVGQPLLPRFAGKLVQSAELLSHEDGRPLLARLAALQAPRVAIVGGSHSALACAHRLLEAAPGLNFGEEGVTVLHRRPLRLTYASPAAALADGYTDFGPEDLCLRTGRVFPLAGFRSDSAALLRRAWRLGGCGPEPRLRLHRLNEESEAEANRILAEADLVVAAFGYRPRALPLFTAGGRRIALRAEAGAPLVDRRSRVLDAEGEPVPSVFGIGLSAGYPLRGTHGEASFAGEANGLALWHGEIGAGILRDLLALVG